jgi:glycosyltransferase involved in cell wall biosynthesis
MPQLVKDKATICVVNYKTPDLIRLCLRSIRKFTKYPYEVIVVDNNSMDESLEYLKRLRWIRLIERNTNNDPANGSGGYAHAAALDLGLENCNTEFFVSMHSDAFVKKDNWLDDLIGYFGGDQTMACVGSGKLELSPRWRIALKKITDLRTFKRKLLRQPDTIGKFRCYNRTICCLYRTGILRQKQLSFLMDRDKGLTVGKKLYFELVDRGYKTVELPASIMGRYIIHLAHATQVINRQKFAVQKKTIDKCNRLIDKVVSSALVQSLLADDLLDE